MRFATAAAGAAAVAVMLMMAEMGVHKQCAGSALRRTWKLQLYGQCESVEQLLLTRARVLLLRCRQSV